MIQKFQHRKPPKEHSTWQKSGEAYCIKCKSQPMVDRCPRCDGRIEVFK